MSGLPKNLNYSSVKPIGFPANIKMMKFYPTSFQSANTNDTIKFNINSNGFWDPYSAYIKIEVDVSGADTEGSLQLDHSASSFINTLIVTAKSVEIERIQEYDQIAAILADMNYTREQRSAHKFEGFGSNVGQSDNSATGRSSIQHVTDQLDATPQYTLTKGPMPFYNIACIPDMSDTLILIAQPGPYNIVGNYDTTGAITSVRYDNQILKYGDETIQTTSQNGLQFITNNNKPNTIQTDGYSVPTCSQLSIGADEPLLSNGISKCSTYQGLLGANVNLPQKQTFCIPLYSGLLGVLMPGESYKYIPMSALDDLRLEFRLNPHAMFTSGYVNAQTASSGLTQQLRRVWKITKFELNVEMQFFEPEIENIIMNQLNSDKGIVIHTQSWMLGPEFPIQNGNGLQGTYSVNLAFESLKVVAFNILSDDYLNYTFCRKLYRLSHQLASFQLKVGNEYFPQTPITGNSGTVGAYPIGDIDSGNNSEFVIQTLKAFGKMHDVLSDCSLNTINFAVNERPYDITTIQSFANAIIATGAILNIDTAQGNSLFHENRCIGKAIYAQNLETLNQDFNVISGINTVNNHPFEITLKKGAGTDYPRSSTMYVFCLFDMLIQFKRNSINVLGKG